MNIEINCTICGVYIYIFIQEYILFRIYILCEMIILIILVILESFEFVKLEKER